MAIGLGVIGCSGRIRDVISCITGMGKQFRGVAVCESDERAIR
jgi:predicted dehydrogenase